MAAAPRGVEEISANTRAAAGIGLDVLVGQGIAVILAE
jgi:hypothetical protein